MLALAHVPDRPGVAAQLFEALGAAGLNVDLIVQATHEGASNDIAFTLRRAEMEAARAVCAQVLAAMGAGAALLSAEGGHGEAEHRRGRHHGTPGVAARLFDTLARDGINLRLIATSEVKVSCLVEGPQGSKALRSAAQAFELGEQQLRHDPRALPPGRSGRPRRGPRSRSGPGGGAAGARPARHRRRDLPRPGRQRHQPRRHRAVGAHPRQPAATSAAT